MPTFVNSKEKILFQYFNEVKKLKSVNQNNNKPMQTMTNYHIFLLIYYKYTQLFSQTK